MRAAPDALLLPQPLQLALLLLTLLLGPAAAAAGAAVQQLSDTPRSVLEAMQDQCKKLVPKRTTDEDSLCTARPQPAAGPMLTCATARLPAGEPLPASASCAARSAGARGRQCGPGQGCGSNFSAAGGTAGSAACGQHTAPQQAGPCRPCPALPCPAAQHGTFGTMRGSSRSASAWWSSSHPTAASMLSPPVRYSARVARTAENPISSIGFTSSGLTSAGTSSSGAAPLAPGAPPLPSPASSARAAFISASESIASTSSVCSNRGTAGCTTGRCG